MARGPAALLVFAVLTHVAAAALPRPHGSKEIYKPEFIVVDNVTREEFNPETSPWIETVSWKPRVQIYHNFITEQEARHVVALAAPQMKRSTVVGSGGKSVTDNIRTSYGTFIRRLQDDVITSIENRLAAWTHLPVVNQEDMQVLRYTQGQKYGAHYDSLYDDSPRVVTVLIYLADTEEGGETAFPQGSQWADPSLEGRFGPFTECAQGHVAMRPKRGDALLFYSLTPDGKQEGASLHTGCPVVQGVKWTATKWIHTKPFRQDTFVRPLPGEVLQDPGECRDYHSGCKGWAQAGECSANPGFMLGGSTGNGQCRASCNDCTPCQPGDAACLAANRNRAGYLVVDPGEMEAWGQAKGVASS